MTVRRSFVVGLAAMVTLAVSAGHAGAKGGGSEDLERVAIRESRHGVALRVYEGTPYESFEGHLPKKCFPNQDLVVEVSTRELAASIWFAARDGAPFDPQGQVIGTAEDAPVAVVLARLPDGMERAEMRFRNGVTDRAESLGDGWVALASELQAVPKELDRVQLLNQPSPSLGRLTFLDDDGERGKPRVVRAFGYGPGSEPECRPLPPPPPPLPDPTGPPPADEPAARAAVEDAYTSVFSGGIRVDEKARDARLALIEDGESVRAASEEIAEIYSDIAGQTKLRVDEIRFLNETEAAVRFDILIDGEPITATTVGRALLVDGTWKVAKSTYCDLVGRGGATC